MNSKEMFSRISWLRPVDIAILDLLESQNRLELTPGNIARNIDYSPNYIRGRTTHLAECGLLAVDEDGDPFYSITDLGEKVLNRDIPPDELEKLGPDR